MAISRLFQNRRTRTEALIEYERLTELPLLVLALAIIPLIALPLLLGFNPAVDRAFFATDWMIWAVFALDLVVRTSLAEQRRRYLMAHWYDVLIVAVPFLRPLRVLRSARALRLLRLTRIASFGARAIADVREFGQRRGVVYVVPLALLLLIGSAALVFAFERNADGNIDDFGTALWWAATTVTTVGYGDTFPVTPEGRGIAVFLMIVGISLFGFLTASIAAFMVEHGQAQSKTTLDDLMAKLESLEAELRTLRREVGQ